MSRNIVRVNKTKNYTVMSNTHLKDKNLSWKAKGLHSYVLSLPDDWKIVLEHLKTISLDGIDSTRTGIKELYENRYWQKYPIHENGIISKWVTEIYEVPFDEKLKIRNIIIREKETVINYENGTSETKTNPVDNFFSSDSDLLTENPSVVENTKVDLLTGNPLVGSQDVASTTLLNTNNTNYLCTNNLSITENNSEDELSFEDKIKKEIERLKKEKTKEDLTVNAILEVNGISLSSYSDINQNLIRETLKEMLAIGITKQGVKLSPEAVKLNLSRYLNEHNIWYSMEQLSKLRATGEPVKYEKRLLGTYLINNLSLQEDAYSKHMTLEQSGEQIY